MTTPIRDCVAPDRNPRPPHWTLPAGAIDTHVHVFEDRYPLTPTRDYNAPESTVADLQHMHATLGVDRVVFTQPSIYGVDNAAILDGMAALNASRPGRARGVIACDLDITEDDLVRLHTLGVRGVRLNTDNRGGMPITMEDVPMLCDRIRDLGWHIEFLFPGSHIVDLLPVFESLTVPMSIGHFAFQRAVDGVDGPGFRALLRLIEQGNTWVKISGADRVSAWGLPPYDDVAPMAHALIDAAKTRVMWGTDWPHPNKFDVVNPNDGDLADALGGWVTDAELRRQILVDTPSSFYGFGS